jgi:type IV secretion system protein VirB3
MRRDMIFKGATRPPMMAGIPILPFIMVAGVTMITTMWTLVFMKSFFGAFVVLMIGAVTLFIMRMVSKHDNQKLNQLMMRMRSTRYRANSNFWNGHSVSPIDYKRR